MFKIIGAILLVSGTAAWGFMGVMRLRARSVILNSLTNVLGIMQSEICDRLTPMPELMNELARESAGPVSRFYQNVTNKMTALGNARFSAIWKQALDTTPELMLTEREMSVLTDLGQSLGCYNTEEQKNALMYAKRRMEDYARRADAAREANSKLHAVLGVASGFFAVVILI